MEQFNDIMKALETFDKAAQSHGWNRDQGSAQAAKKAERLYNAAKARLVKKIREAIE